MKWRVIPLETHDAAMAMALDEAATDAVRAGAPPTIRFYRWLPSAVSIGYFQSMETEVNLDACRQLGVDQVRRRTGGGTVYHDCDGEITYSVIAPELLFSWDTIASYRHICGWIVDALSRLGICAEFKPINDIVTGGKKISGNAQTRRGKVLLQHGTILYDLDVARMFTVLKVAKEKISDKMIAAVEDRVTCIRRVSNATRDETYHALYEAFTRDKAFYEGSWTEEELAFAKELADTKYSTEEWNFQR